jgi:osmotically-inducible protein OsmY
MQKTDLELRAELQHELRWDTRLSATAVRVDVDRAVVTLTGNVASWAMRLAAGEAALRVYGVLEVVNLVHVALPSGAFRSDRDLAYAAHQILRWDSSISDCFIQASVLHGWITLAGEVSYWSQREDAERALRNLAGVCGVINLIEIRPKTIPNDVRRAIEAALERRASRTAVRCAVEVRDGRVRLSGEVGSWVEKQMILDAVKTTPGVQAIEDQLRMVSSNEPLR